MSETKRLVLWRSIKLMLLVLLLAFVYVLLSGTIGSSNPNSSTGSLRNEVSIGATRLQTLEGNRVWITRFSRSQKSDYDDLSEHVITNSGCAKDLEFCVLIASTQKDGINVSFSDTAPPQLPDNVPWVGGFVNPLNGAMFDLWGRAYRVSDVESLVVIEIE